MHDFNIRYINILQLLEKVWIYILFLLFCFFSKF
jgi:hypothetical protein